MINFLDDNARQFFVMDKKSDQQNFKMNGSTNKLIKETML